MCASTPVSNTELSGWCSTSPEGFWEIWFPSVSACLLLQLEAKRQISAQQLQGEFEALCVDVEAAAAAFKHVEESDSYMPVLEGLRRRVQAARAEVESLRKAEGLFGLDALEFEQLESVCLLFDRLNEVTWTTEVARSPSWPLMLGSASQRH